MLTKEFAVYQTSAFPDDPVPGHVLFVLFPIGDAKPQHWMLEQGTLQQAWSTVEAKLAANHPKLKMIRR